MEKVNVVEENFGLYRFPGKGGRKSIFVGFNGDKSTFVYGEGNVATVILAWAASLALRAPQTENTNLKSFIF